MIWYNFDNNQLVAIGDSKARIDGVTYNDGEKMVDILNSALRVKVIEELKLTEQEIAENDLGRFYIMPLLQKQSEFQNNPEAPKVSNFGQLTVLIFRQKNCGFGILIKRRN